MSSKFANQDPAIVSIFEVIGAYFTDIVFNHLYSVASQKAAGGNSITDCYLQNATAYTIGVKNDERCYREVVENVHRFFTDRTAYTTISFGGFVDRIVGACVPAEYFKQLPSQEKDELLSSIICQLVSDLAAYATTPDMLQRTIDRRSEPGMAPTAIRMMQDVAVSSLLTKRQTLHNKFLRSVGQSTGLVSLDAVEDLKRALRRVVKEKAEAVAAAREAEAMIDSLRRKLQDAKSRLTKFEKLIRLMNVEKDSGRVAAAGRLRVPPSDRRAERDSDDDPLARRGFSQPGAERRAEGQGEPPAASKRRAAAAPPVNFFEDIGDVQLPARVLPTRAPRQPTPMFASLMDSVVDIGDNEDVLGGVDEDAIAEDEPAEEDAQPLLMI